MNQQARAILWAQWRTLWNYYPRSGVGGIIFSLVAIVSWYGIWFAGAISLAVVVADSSSRLLVARVLPYALLLAFVYWQVVPVLMASAGASLELRKVLVYPVPISQLFSIDVMLRLTTGVEMLLMLSGATAGMLLNHWSPWWSPLAFAPFVCFNLFLAAGIRGLLGRLLARKRIRELLVFALVLVAALPQFLLLTGMPTSVRSLIVDAPLAWTPWGAAGRIATGEASLAALSISLAWVLAAYAFGRWQFGRSLRFDVDEARAADRAPARAGGLAEWLYRIPRALFADPLGVMLEKEIRFLSRAPRFRLVFLMGFSFGLLIWLPIAFGGSRGAESGFADNYLTFVSVYALMLLGEVSFWNSFGFDRAAVQVYFVMPVRFSTVLIGKNIAAATFVFLEISAVAIVCLLLRMPLSPAKIAEAYAVTLVMTLYLLGIGNLGSTHYPRPIDPAQSWRSSGAGKFQAMLLLVYPLISLPVALAYLARFAFDSEAAFYGGLALAAALGAVVYWIAMESAVSAADKRKEQILTALSQTSGPIS